MAYTKYQADWQDGSGGGTPIDGNALDHIENGIQAAAADADTAQVDATQALADAATADGKAVTADGKAVAAQSTANGAIQESTAVAKGDLLVATAASTVAPLTVGTNERLLEADSTQAAGMKWGRKITIAAVAPPSPQDGDIWLQPKV